MRRGRDMENSETIKKRENECRPVEKTHDLTNIYVKAGKNLRTFFKGAVKRRKEEEERKESRPDPSDSNVLELRDMD